ncbi:MAG: hypothetical protein CMN75_13150 [Spirochaeta sp.]|nr:hypothetical protein [Spirochaeta sp.]
MRDSEDYQGLRELPLLDATKRGRGGISQRLAPRRKRREGRPREASDLRGVDARIRERPRTH